MSTIKKSLRKGRKFWRKVRIPVQREARGFLDDTLPAIGSARKRAKKLLDEVNNNKPGIKMPGKILPDDWEPGTPLAPHLNGGGNK